MSSNSIKRVVAQSVLNTWDQYDPMMQEWAYNLDFVENWVNPNPSEYIYNDHAEHWVDSEAPTPIVTPEDDDAEPETQPITADDDLMCYENLDRSDDELEPPIRSEHIRYANTERMPELNRFRSFLEWLNNDNPRD